MGKFIHLIRFRILKSFCLDTEKYNYFESYSQQSEPFSYRWHIMNDEALNIISPPPHTLTARETGENPFLFSSFKASEWCWLCEHSQFKHSKLLWTAQICHKLFPWSSDKFLTRAGSISLKIYFWKKKFSLNNYKSQRQQ